MRYSFSNEELEDLWLLAGKFQQVKEDHGIKSYRIAEEYRDREMHYVNLKAIHATAAILDRPYNRTVLVSGRKDAPIFLDDGRSVRVYTRQADLSLYEPFDSDFAVLATPVLSIHPDPYIKSMSKHNYKHMDLVYCSRERFKEKCRQGFMRGKWKWVLRGNLMTANLKGIAEEENLGHQAILF